jgi:RNA polymerase sigma-70 factor (ECF subfamily)
MAHEHHGDCREVFALLSAYLDAELPAATCQEIEAHLADCPPCIEFLHSLRRTIELCHGCESAEVPEPLAPAAREELARAYRQMLVRRGAASGEDRNLGP